MHTCKTRLCVMDFIPVLCVCLSTFLFGKTYIQTVEWIILECNTLFQKYTNKITFAFLLQYNMETSSLYCAAVGTYIHVWMHLIFIFIWYFISFLFSVSFPLVVLLFWTVNIFIWSCCFPIGFVCITGVWVCVSEHSYKKVKMFVAIWK